MSTQYQSNCRVWQRRLLNYVYPVIYLFGRMFGVQRESLELWYIRRSNVLNKSCEYHIPAEKILLLVPHCLQRDSCEHKITRHIDNCEQCGGCKIGTLVALRNRYGFHLEAATGGTLARQLVKQYAPDAIVAVACHRDLASGLMDVFPLPIIGVLNERPFGPCFNTDVDLLGVQDAIEKFLGVRHE